MILLRVLVTVALCWLTVSSDDFEPISNLTITDFEAPNTDFEPISNLTLEFEPINNLSLDVPPVDNLTLEIQPISNSSLEFEPISNLTLFECPDGFYFDGIYCVSNIPAEISMKPLARCPEGQYLDAYSRTCKITITTTEQKCPFAVESVAVQRTSIVATSQSSPMPAETTCSEGFTWNGWQCLELISVEAECAENYHFIDGTCQSIQQGYCPDNFQLIGSQCIYKSEINVQCPLNHTWDGEMCVHTIPSCPYGYSLTNGVCQKTTSGYCPSNTQLVNGVCVLRETSNVQCTTGFDWNGSECVHSVYYKCDAGYQLLNGRCVKEVTHSPIYNCPNGTRLSGTMCIPLQDFCPIGYSYSNEECVVISLCPPGFVHKDNRCVRSKCPPSRPSHLPVLPTCPDGYVLLNRTCFKYSVPLVIPGNPITPGTPETVAPIPACPNQYVLQNGTCVSTENESEHPVILYCPAEFLLQGDLCIRVTTPTQPPTLICAIGYVFRSGVCVSVSTGQPPTTNGTIVVTCPDNSITFSNGTCMQINVNENDTQIDSRPCLPGFKVSLNSTCVVDTEITINPCQNGTISTWNNGSCIFDHTNVPVNNGTVVVGKCPEGFAVLNGTCVQVITKPPRCPFGFTLRRNGICTKTVPICDIGYKFKGNACYPIPARQTEPPSNPDNGHNTNSTDGKNSTIVHCSGEGCDITNTVHINNTIHQPNNVVTTNENNVIVNLWSDGQLVSVTRNNETIFYPTTDRTSVSTDDTTERHDSRAKEETVEEGMQTSSAAPVADDERCCEVVSPRQCRKESDGWHCYHRRYHRCGKFCTQSTVQLAPRRSRYRQPVLVMPPAPPRYWRLMSYRNSVYGHGVGMIKLLYEPVKVSNHLSIFIDCSGCIDGGFRCSIQCFQYDECRDTNDCYIADAQSFCSDYGGDGCSTDDGCFE